jgi:hypothetical protein
MPDTSLEPTLVGKSARLRYQRARRSAQPLDDIMCHNQV